MFKKAVAVWKSFGNGKDSYNRHIIFKEVLPSLSGLKIKISANDLYRLKVNGSFAGYGPARCARGYSRVDEYDLSRYDLGSGGNEISIEVAGYGCRSYYTVMQQPHFTAEVTDAFGNVILYTGRDFTAYENKKRLRYVERISAQRHFCESYDERIEIDGKCKIETEPIDNEPIYIERSVPYPSYGPLIETDEYFSGGIFTEGDPSSIERIWYYKLPSSEWRFFPSEDIDRSDYRYIKSSSLSVRGGKGKLPQAVCEGEWIKVHFDKLEVGFIKFLAKAKAESEIIVAFSEYSDGDSFRFGDITMHTTMRYVIGEGQRIDAESFEVYSMTDIAIFVLRGEVELESVGLRPYKRSTDEVIKREFRHPELKEIYEAALRSFSHNAVDLYTDCPSRERAGWLCDSFFSARAEYFFYGKTTIEDAFLENYRLYKNDGGIPDGALPMCYPADYSNGGGFIPQWAMWYVLEVSEYVTERGHTDKAELFRESVMGVLAFLERHENSLGLLEGLPSWNFVEWSDANNWVKDINYPTNFLYSAVLREAGELYGIPELLEKSKRVAALTEQMAFDGEIFIDNAIRSADGSYENTKNSSEACQYYAILLGKIDLECEKYRKLKSYVLSGFSDLDTEGRAFCRINAFIGLYLRINVLLELGEGKILRDNIISHCLPMVRDTGTLWEFKEKINSLDHGFASYIALALPMADEA